MFLQIPLFKPTPSLCFANSYARILTVFYVHIYPQPVDQSQDIFEDRDMKL